jgi:hypothetical protein
MGNVARSFKAGTELHEKADDDAALEDATLEVDTLELFDETVVVGAEDVPPPPHEHKIKIGNNKHTINIFFIYFPSSSFFDELFFTTPLYQVAQ